jgi:ribonucleoside-diphosphate reductase beta chain
MREATKRNLLLGNEINKKIMKLHPMNYPEAKEIWEAMLSNNWTVSEVNMADDFYDFKNLDESEKSMYGKALAFLSNLDGIQFNNLADNINKYVTAPEISLCLSRQAFEEALHVHAYSTMIESMGYFPDEIYEMFLTDEILFKKNNYILKQSSILGKEFSIENFIFAVDANNA